MHFSRPCKQLNAVLLESDEIAPYRKALADAGFRLEHDSGLKIIVKPQHYEAVLVAIQGRYFKSKDVIVDPEVESVVLQLVECLPKKNKVYHRSSQVFPLGFLLSAGDDSLQISWTRKFIAIKVPSSMLSASISDGPKTI